VAGNDAGNSSLDEVVCLSKDGLDEGYPKEWTNKGPKINDIVGMFVNRSWTMSQLMADERR